MAGPRVLVMGCGGIGGIVAASLFDRGGDVVAVTHNPEIAAAITHRGLQVRYQGTQRTVPALAFAELPAACGTFDFVFLLMQPPQVAGGARSTRPLLRPNGAMVCFQNGLCEEHVQPIAGAGHTIGAIVAWGGSMVEPGVYDRTSGGGFVIGRLDAQDDPRFELLRDLLAPIGSVEVTRNLRGARWSKLAINCAVSSLGTIGGHRLGTLIRYRFVRRLALEAMTEAVAVARARGVQLEKVSGTIDLEWVRLTPADVTRPGSPTLLAKHALLLAVGAKFRRMRSSMLAAIERGREPAVDSLNGEVVATAAQLGMSVPLNTRICETIHAIARGERRPGVPQLRRLYAGSRSSVYKATLAGFLTKRQRPAAASS